MPRVVRIASTAFVLGALCTIIRWHEATVLAQQESASDPEISFRDVIFSLPGGGWERLEPLEDATPSAVEFARVEGTGTRRLAVTSVEGSRVLARSEQAAALFAAARQAHHGPEPLTDFAEGQRVIGGMTYPIMTFRAKLAGGGDGLYLVYFPADFEKRGRYFVLVWRDARPADTAGHLEDLDAVVSSFQVRPIGTVLLTDSFDDPDTGPFPQAPSEPGPYMAGYDNGEYVVNKLDASWAEAPGESTAASFADITVSVDARITEGGRNATALVTCRRSVRGTGYRLGIQPEVGRFIVSRMRMDGATALVDWRSSDAIRRSDTNHLELTCAGNRISAAINGTPVAAVDDNTYAEGGVWLGAAASGGTVEARFSNLLVAQH